MNYAPRPYYKSTKHLFASFNRKRQIIDAFINDLHTHQLKYIDEAVEQSDMRQAREVIDYIRQL
jgi:hypothetical protein